MANYSTGKDYNNLTSESSIYLEGLLLSLNRIHARFMSISSQIREFRVKFSNKSVSGECGECYPHDASESETYVQKFEDVVSILNLRAAELEDELEVLKQYI